MKAEGSGGKTTPVHGSLIQEICRKRMVPELEFPVSEVKSCSDIEQRWWPALGKTSGSRY